jgi:hypothetical protein
MTLLSSIIKSLSYNKDTNKIMSLKKRNYLYQVIGIMCITSVIYYVYQKTKELFSGINIMFLTEQETKSFLNADEDRYISSMTVPDLYARHVPSHLAYREKAVQSAISFTEAQKAKIEASVEFASAFLNTHISEYIDPVWMNKIPWKIALTKHRNYEDGLPHTRNDIIFLTDVFVNTLSKQKLTETLIHEKIHIYQRFYPALIQETLEKNGYSIWRERRNYPLIRSNPDLDHFIYKHPSGEIMVSVYRNDTPTSIQDTMQPNELHEHPYEEIAYTIANRYTLE